MMFLKGYGVACITFSTGLLLHPIPELVEVLGATLAAGIVLTIWFRVRGAV